MKKKWARVRFPNSLDLSSRSSSSQTSTISTMDAREHQEKDFLSSMFSDDQQQQPQLNNMFSIPYSQPTVQPSMPQTMSPELSMDMLNNLMSMQGIESQPTSPTSPQYNPQSLLEQQFKLTQLQQLQQLQNQIFQQQIALISSQTAGIMQSSPSIEPRRDQTHQFTGLPTPGPSAEIQAQPPPIDFVSPIILNNSYMDAQGSPYQSDPHMSSMNNHGLNSNYAAPRGSTSAPEHIAFRTNLPPSADLDFDISPLTSPWLGAHQHQQAMSNFSSSNKRNASSSGDEGCGMPSRKRQSPAIRPTNPSVQGSSSKKYVRGSKSTSSTPLMRSTRSRKESTAGEAPGDTPSPVDLSMPPPAPPLLESSSSSSLSSEQIASSPQFNPHLMPVTPASIMKLGRLGINNNGNGMAPPTRQVVPLKADSKGKAPASSSTATTKPKAADTPRSKGTRKSATSGSLTSPSLKAILPAGAGSYPHPHPLPLSSPLLLPTPGAGMAVRKTSHKAAEQKRRDSLKTTFDDLRVLLPPIPLPTDDRYPVDEILPGALPPRGPPKAGGEGPNKGVSKLQLLMCGNEYIRVLKARVERRDEEVGRLRREVRRLRLGVGGGIQQQGEEEEGEEVDLERDLDAVEALGGGTLGMGMGSGPAPGVGTMPTLGEDEGDDDPGED
ncbi:hypothetical protein D9615_008394 [Tricholomella constricta]|uniref:BHLH domain-containing protein n=1 Tax=Tricholomella constricta TaxID=117010 RepID=A0A8H5HDD8_9AGAR|nr:hypothetical protein D9615_008394 [Tricholomella constricta]